MYADDTLLIDSDPALVQEPTRCIEECGMHRGLQLNWRKLELMEVRSDADVVGRDRSPTAAKQSLFGLGTSLAADGRVSTKLSRRIGAAGSDCEVFQSGHMPH